MKLNSPLFMGLLTASVVTTLGLVTHAQSPSPQPMPKSNGRPSAMTDAQANQLAMEAYVYAYPLVTMEMTRRQFTNVAKPEATRAPMGQFANLRKYPDASFKGVTAPNADTLYSTAWLDLMKEPMVLELPGEAKRFYMMPILDGWTNVIADPGTRTTGTKPQKYLITGPRFSGAIPAGLTEIKSPTAMVWILGRTYSSGTPADYKEVHALQDKYKLTPLSAYEKGGKFTAPMGKVDPSIDMKTPPREQVNAMSGPAYFALFAKLLAENPPAPADKPMVEKLAKLGIVPGQPFDAKMLDPKVAAAMERAPKQALAMIEQGMQKAPKVNGWVVDKTGDYGTDYPKRAMIAFFGLGANRPEDAIYPTTMVDSENKPLDASSNNYVLTFKNKEDLPPVRGFWSLTMYDKNFFFVKNPINRQTLSARDKLKANPDGTISLYIQNKSPGKDKESNWLPAPAGPFVLMMRLYWPTEQPPSILDGTWKPPAVERAPSAQAQVEPQTPQTDQNESN
ncbi:MAG: DUF1254 domain-containing protein [Kofleriaceae bacterium]|nr:DUF1254 domain-containing protein [Kofleriaceae bacterium]